MKTRYNDDNNILYGDKISYRPASAAKMLDIGRSTLYNLIKSGDLRAVRIGGCTLIPAENLHALLARRSNGEAR